LFRGLQLLKVGGKISYSTCSLNPIEDESVVAMALKAFPGCLELVKVDVKGFKFRPGYTNWRVLTLNKDIKKPA
jgi:multisite-specific tRNA:(cytosine-C5)-methyltransferase